MQLNSLVICCFAAAYCCFVVYVPNNPNLYTFTVDVLSSILSCSACVTLQTFISSSASQTLLGGICIQFLVTQELSVIHFVSLRLVSNITPEGLIKFYSEYTGLAKYVTNTLTIASCRYASLLTLSVARLVLIVSPAYFQSINRKLVLRLSIAFIASAALFDFLLNHVRCMLTHSSGYESISMLRTRLVVGIAVQVSNQTESNTTWIDQTPRTECIEFLLPPILLFLSALLEAIKIVIYMERVFRKAKQTTPSGQPPAPAVSVIQLSNMRASGQNKIKQSKLKGPLGISGLRGHRD